ncbi:MAG: hypothetical protein FWG79_06050 [Bacteroidales bacterium]|nr:hypothetical protein [Bacteroidales bacterium]
MKKYDYNNENLETNDSTVNEPAVAYAGYTTPDTGYRTPDTVERPPVHPIIKDPTEHWWELDTETQEILIKALLKIENGTAKWTPWEEIKAEMDREDEEDFAELAKENYKETQYA